MRPPENQEREGSRGSGTRNPAPGRLAVPSDGRREKLERFIQDFGLTPNARVLEEINKAFVHRSYRTEALLALDNERLEFLGDSVIGLVTTEYLLECHPLEAEGWLSKLRATMVSRAVLGEIGKDLGIGPLMLLGTGEERNGGRDRSSIIGSALEAVCGVLYEHYRWEELRGPLRETVVIRAADLVEREHLVDYKSQLQEVTQRFFQTVPDYVVISEDGPDHQKTFLVQVVLAGRSLGCGKGARKKLAENDAAHRSLEVLREENPTFFL